MSTLNPTGGTADAALLHAIERATNAGLAAVDASGRQTYVSPEFCRLVGWEAQDLLGRWPPFPYWPPESMDAIRAAFAQTVAGTAPEQGFELRFMRQDGERIAVRLLISPLLAGPDAAGWLAIVRESAVERRAERQRLDLELIATLVENSGEGIIVVDEAGQFILFNREARLQHGHQVDLDAVEPDEWASNFGLLRTDLTPLPREEIPLWQALQGRRVDDARWCLRRPDGSVRTLEGTATPIRRVDGSIGGAMIITRDVTQREQEQQALADALRGEQQAHAQAERSLRLFEGVLQTAPIGLSFLDNDLRYVRINALLASYNGVPIEQTVGRLQREVVPGVAQQLEPIYRSVFATGEPVVGIQVTLPATEGSAERQTEAGIFPIFDAHGRPWLVGTAVREVTWERRLQAEQIALRERAARAEALADSREALRLSDAILRAVPDAVILCDLDLHIQRWLGGAERIFGTPAQGAVGRRLGLIWEESDDLATTRRITEALERRGGFGDVIACRRSDGSAVEIELTVTRFADEAGQPVALLCVARDVTERLRAERERSLRERMEADERRFRTLAEATSDIVWRTDPQGRIEVDSPSWRTFTGQSLQSWLDNEGWRAVHPDDRERVARVWKQAVQTLQPYSTEFRVRRHDGVYVPMSVRGAPVHDAQGRVVEWIGANIDITARILQEAERQRLLESEQRARAEAEAARQRMALLDRVTARLVGETRGAEQVMQTLADLLVESLGHWCGVQVPRTDRSIALVAVAHRDPSMAEAARRHVERFPVDPDIDVGVPRVLRTGRSESAAGVSTDLLDRVATDPAQRAEIDAWHLGAYIIVPLVAQGSVVGALSLVREASAAPFNADELALVEEIGVRAGLSFEQARLLQEAQAARAEAEAASRARDDFLAMLGHELRNPLAPIVTALELMKLRGGSELVRERGILERQVRHMTRLVDDLLDVSRIARNKIELRRERIEIADACTRAIETTQPLFDQKRHRLEVSIESGLMLDGDVARLEQVFCNVLVNAAKYTPSGGRVRLMVRRKGGLACIELIDDGVGVDPELLPHVFDLFIQGRQAIDRSAGGLGLGLTIVRRMVEAHHGRVQLHSDGVGRGTTVKIELPLASGEPPRPPEEPTALPVPPTALAMPRVMVVDDNLDAATLLAQVLRDAGFDICMAHDGPGALALAAEWQPDAVLLDIGLPGMDGYEVARRLRTGQDSVVPLLIAITGYGQPGDGERARAAGFAHHLVKPVEQGRLLSILAALHARPQRGATVA